MIRRTLFEWRSLSYGKGDDQIPDLEAGRLAAVARASPLGGPGGGRILSHGRHDLRAKQVVGILAADGVVLEILPKIDVPDGAGALGETRRRLVHMLAVAIDVKIAVGAVSDLDWQRDTLLEILISLFVRKLSDEVRKGMPRRYVGCQEDLPALRGRLDLTRQLTRLIASPGRLACEFDALSPDILLNQIMKTAVLRLATLSRSAENQRRLRELAFFYADIADVAPGSIAWDALVLDRTNARWRELVNLARLFLGERFQTTSAGGARGFSLLFEMHNLFEQYVARILKRALSGTGVQVLAQGGRLFCLEDEETAAGRFMTRPDILIKRGGVVEMVIDTKWKRISRRIDDPKQGVSQSDVYQMMAYGHLYQCDQLLLLYPHHAGLGVEEGLASRHRLTGTKARLATATLNLVDGGKVGERLADMVRQAVETLEPA